MNDDVLAKVLELISEINKTFDINSSLQMQWSQSPGPSCECLMMIPGLGCILFDSLEIILKKRDSIFDCLNSGIILQESADNFNELIKKLAE